MSSNRIIICNPQQFGLNTDYVMYAKYLQNHFKEVCYITINQGYSMTDMSGVKFHYIPKFSFKQISYLLFFLYCLFFIMLHPGKIMTSNFSGCRYLKKMIPWRKMTVNIRTVSVNHNKAEADIKNKKILNDVLPYDRIIMISEGGAKQLKLPLDRTKIVALGADVLSVIPKMFDYPRLLYIGTLTGRNIIQTVKGFHQYLISCGADNKAQYNIVGNGEEYETILNYVKSHGLTSRVKLHGFKPYDELKPFLDECNIGVSYVPITDGFMFQPPTKTFEYINSGLYCIATKTKANEDVITNRNGMLIDDNANSFMNALIHFDKIKGAINETEIRQSGEKYLWENIIDDQLINSLM